MPQYTVLKNENGKETELGTIEAKACDSALIEFIGNAKVWYEHRIYGVTRYRSRTVKNLFFDVIKLPKAKPQKQSFQIVPVNTLVCFAPTFFATN